MTVSPTSVIAGTIGNTLTFIFAAPSSKDFNAGSQATILVPAGWTAPTSGNVVVTTGPAPACSAAALGTITGTGPWTIPINMTCVAKAQFTVTFSGVTAPVTTGVNTFTTKTKQNLGTLTNITTPQPTVTVNAAGSFKVGVVSVGAQTGTLTYGTAGSATFLITVTRSGSGSFTANLTLPAPAGASFSFSPSSLSFTSSDTSKTSTLTINTASTTPAGATSFTVQAKNPDPALPADYGQGTGTLTVNKKNLTISGAVANNKEYDGNTTATVSFSGASLVGVVGVDAVTINSAGYSATFADKTVAKDRKRAVQGVALSGAAAGNYTVSQPSGLTANITAKNLTISGAVANNKQYDGNATATVTFSGASLVGVIGLDAVTINSAGYSATFADKTVANGKPVTVLGVALSGADAGNYTVSQPSGLTANITAKNLTITGAAANNREYDGTTTATVNFSLATLVGVVSGDAVSINSGGYSATFATKTDRKSVV